MDSRLRAALREEAVLRDLRLALLVDLEGLSLRADLLPVTPAVLVEEAHPPDAGALGVFVDAALTPSDAIASFLVVHVFLLLRIVRTPEPRAPSR